ncbi:DNA primase/polymerase [Rhodococcus phage Apiary]|nr:DNA primase/polymerase [Rhodococcus phage Braxoaddie]WNM64976.1 DNA primase/polymerase [Rhodococcus phage Maselop]WNM67437.1 DNA primase/polymerase [Rhodococcus phage Polyyuki]WNM69861.1 DNA primase/polymerase [Rhodococcus phage Apiary]
MTYGTAAPLYLQRGWNTPLPLPAGRKYPPPEDSTGNYPDVEESQIESWIVELDDQNLGLRMPRVKLDGEMYEVVGIDIDQYDDKRGWDAIQSVFSRVGALPPTYRSTSRGPLDPSGIRYYLVPAGQKWVGKVCDDVEVIQRSHRYSVAWPSVVKAGKGTRQYEWYDHEDEELDGPPRVKDIPHLPLEWQEFLSKGEAVERRRHEGAPELETIKGAREWMLANIPGYDELPSSEMAKASLMDDLRDEAYGGAHDMLVSRSHRVIMLAIEGHHGLQSALEAIQTAFYDEVLGANDDDSARRGADEARREVNRAIVQEVQKVQQDIEDGYLAISAVGGFSADDEEIDTGLLQEKTLAKLMERRRMMIDLDTIDYADNDMGRSRLFLAGAGDLVCPVDQGDTWAMWDPALRRLTEVTERGLTWVWEKTVIASLKNAADTRFSLADAQLENGLEEESKETMKEAKDYARQARISGNKSIIRPAVEMAHAMSDERITQADFDKNPLLIGVGNGVLDFTAAKTGATVDRDTVLRPGNPEDLIFENAEVEYHPNVKSALWDSYLETFLPDLEYRRFVRKVFGYSLLGGNPQRFMIFLQGGTSTGKSTIIRAVEMATGGYSTTVQANALFREKQDSGPSPEVLTAMPKRMIFSSEIGNHNRLHADVIKRLTGGDSISARALYSNTVVTRTPMFTPIIATNSEPTIQDGDAALWRRLLVLPFDKSVPQETVPRQKIEESPEALQAVLAWLVEGLLDYLDEGLAPDTWPSSCSARAKKFISGTSDFQTFLSETTTPGGNQARVEAQKFFQLYQSWCATEGVRPADILTRHGFTKRLASNGIVAKRTSVRVDGKKNPTSKMMYVGVSLNKEMSTGDHD